MARRLPSCYGLLMVFSAHGSSALNTDSLLSSSQNRGYLGRIVEAPELAPEAVDRNALHRQALGAPGLGLQAGGAQHPGADRQYQAGFLRDRQEFGTAHDAELGARPAHQRLHPGNASGAHVELWLVE